MLAACRELDDDPLIPKPLNPKPSAGQCGGNPELRIPPWRNTRLLGFRVSKLLLEARTFEERIRFSLRGIGFGFRGELACSKGRFATHRAAKPRFAVSTQK